MNGADNALRRLLEVMARLRDPQHGCPWDRAQDFASIAPYTIEEAYEVADAIDANDPGKLREELGDLLFQVVFHAQLARERGWFDFDDVAGGIVAKLERRHPHVFAGAPVGSASEQNRAWERFKAQERAAAGNASVLAAVPRALPALARAAKLSARAARVGFDFAGAPDARVKVDEELSELDSALAQREGATRCAEELGDLLFAIVNWARHLELVPEEALRDANSKFEHRFCEMERRALARGLVLDQLSAHEWDALWNEAKVS
jgi:nucleoside triphosphate diphosphatase